MAFPTGYTKYQEITIDYTKVAADLTNYVVYVNLADLVKAGADIFDLCRSDGGDIRATKSDGTTELATQLVWIDTTAKTGELHIKYSGTLSSTTNTVIRIYYNGTDTALAANATYGSQNVWTDYAAVWHLQEAVNTTTDGYKDSTANANHLTGYGLANPAADVKLGKGQDFDGSDDSIERATTTSLNIQTQTFTATWWGGSDIVASDDTFFGETNLGGGHYGARTTTTAPTTAGKYRWRPEIDTSSAVEFVTNTDLTAGTTYFLGMTYDGANLTAYLNGATDGSAAKTGNLKNSALGFKIGERPQANTLHLDGKMDELRISGTKAFSTNEILTTYRNQNSASTFYSTGAEVGGGTTVNVSAQALTFSLPAETVTGRATVSVNAQVGTFSLPAETVKANWKVDVATQVATFNIPAYIVVAGGIAIAPSPQVLTFSLPTETVLGNAIVSPDAQSLMFSLPVSAVTADWQVSVNPVVLTVTLPTLQFVGAVWGRSARSTTGADWTRSTINNA